MAERMVKILVSACLLGEKVRYDGGHKRDSFLIETLGPFVEWVRVCPDRNRCLAGASPPVVPLRSAVHGP